MKRYNSFSANPIITVNPNRKKPFKLLNNIEYVSGDYNDLDIYTIFIPKGYSWDGATFPQIFWSIIGSKYNPEFLPASMVHDWLCEHKDFILKDGARISSDIFRDILILYKVPERKANLMATCVYLWQKFFVKGWK